MYRSLRGPDEKTGGFVDWDTLVSLAVHLKTMYRIGSYFLPHFIPLYISWS